MHPIHFVKNRIDESKSNTGVNIRNPNIPKAQRPEFQVVKTMEEAGLLSSDTSKEAFDGHLEVNQISACDLPTTSSGSQQHECTPSITNQLHSRKSVKQKASENTSETTPLMYNEEDSTEASEFFQRISNKYTPLEVNYRTIVFFVGGNDLSLLYYFNSQVSFIFFIILPNYYFIAS